MDQTAEASLRQLVAAGDHAGATARLQGLNPRVAAELFTSLAFDEQRALFVHLPVDFAAQLAGHLLYYHAYVLLHSRPLEEMRAIVSAMEAGPRDQFIDALPEETWRTLIGELYESYPPPGIETPPAAPPDTKPDAAPVAKPATDLPEAIIEARKIEKSFRQPDGHQVQIIAPTDISIEADSVTALLGPSGSGKSTLLRMLSGLAAPSAGEVLWHGAPMPQCDPNVAIVFQSFALFPWLTVLSNVEAPLLARGMDHAERHRRATSALNTVGLKGFENAYPKELSGGMKQRVGIARALAVDPEILFMDEPFSALDVLTAESLRRELLELWLEKKIPTRAIFIVTHNIEEAVLLADRIIVLGRGPATIRADFGVPLAQPRERKSAAFLLYVDYIYKVMTQPQLDLAPPSARGAVAKITVQNLPHTRPGSIAGLLELLLDRGGEEDLYHVAEDLRMELDDLLPIVEGAVLLGFAMAKEGDVQITPAGREFAEADIPTRKVTFRHAALEHVAMLQQMKSALERKSDHTMPLEFYRDILDERFPEQETERQVETLLNWGRYAEIFAFDSENDAIHIHDPATPVSEEEALRH
jgi:NitT/TauT family transport system ATP-binding protein